MPESMGTSCRRSRSISVTLQDGCNDGFEFSKVVYVGPAPMMSIVMRSHQVNDP